LAAVDDLIGGGPIGLNAGEWIDDTSMALCLAESILDTGAMNLADQLLAFPIPDRSVIAFDKYRDITAAIEKSVPVGGVYVHCWGGVGRTGTVIGCVLADQGLNYDQVLGRLAELRHGTKKAHRPIPETDAQRQIIRRRVGTVGR
jgi:hypothetical protein